MYDLKEQKILKTIFENPTTKFHLLELARQTGLHPNTAINTLKKLEKKDLVIQEKKKYIKEIYANKNNPEFNIEKKIFNLKQIYASGILNLIIENFKPESVSLIGSYSRGEDIEDSDVDMVVISREKYFHVNLEKIEKIIKRKIHLIITNYKEISEEFYINLINGIVIYGAINKK
jgi:predicted nucleotidyltransferase